MAPLALLFKLNTVLLSDSVEGLVPPDVGRQTDARRTRLVLVGVRELLLQCHFLDQSGRSCQRIRIPVANCVVAERTIRAVWEVSC